jgi:hypothetical protein
LSRVEQAAEHKMMRVETQAAQNPQVCTFVSQQVVCFVDAWSIAQVAVDKMIEAVMHIRPCIRYRQVL